METHCKAVCNVAMVMLWTSHLIIAVNFLYSYVCCDNLPCELNTAKHKHCLQAARSWLSKLLLSSKLVSMFICLCVFVTKAVNNYIRTYVR